MNQFSVISLFAGCGGMDLGFRGDFTFLDRHYSKNPFNIKWANDIERNCGLTYKLNFGKDMLVGDIGKILEDNQLPKSADIVLGGFPCQDFSLAGKRRGFDNIKRGLLYKKMVEVVNRIQPLIFVAENVKGLLLMEGGKVLEAIEKDFGAMGYHISTKLHNSANYGVPQKRERIIIVGTRADTLPKFSHPDTALEKVTARQALNDLEFKKEGEAHNHFWSKAVRSKGQGSNPIKPDQPGPTMRAEHHGNIEFHWNNKRRLSAREAARIQSFPDDFIFLPSTSSAYKQIGNAVPPVMAWHIAQSIADFLQVNLKQSAKNEIKTNLINHKNQNTRVLTKTS